MSRLHAFDLYRLGINVDCLPVLDVPIAGSIPLFMAGTLVQLLATTSLGIFIGTLSRNMPQLGLMMILVVLPLELLSGGMTPRESMPELVQNIMLAARARGLDTCPQAAWVDYTDIVLPHVGAGDNEMLVCGLSLGYADPADKVNTFHTPREPVANFTTWLE